MPPIEIPELHRLLAWPRWTASSASSWRSSIRMPPRLTPSRRVEQLRIRWIGRKQGLLTRVGEVLKGAPPEAREEVGKRFNALKSAIEPRCDPEQISQRGARTGRR